MSSRVTMRCDLCSGESFEPRDFVTLWGRKRIGHQLVRGQTKVDLCGKCWKKLTSALPRLGQIEEFETEEATAGVRR